jgi:hypothetical protein
VLFAKLLHEWGHYLFHVHAHSGVPKQGTPTHGIFAGEAGYAVERFVFGVVIKAVGRKSPAYNITHAAYGKSNLDQPTHLVPGAWLDQLVSLAWWTAPRTRQDLAMPQAASQGGQHIDTLITQHFLAEQDAVKKAVHLDSSHEDPSAERHTPQRGAKRKLSPGVYKERQTTIPFKARKLSFSDASKKIKLTLHSTPAEVAAYNRQRLQRTGIKV